MVIKRTILEVVVENCLYDPLNDKALYLLYASSKGADQQSQSCILISIIVHFCLDDIVATH